MRVSKITVVDHGLGNLFSVCRALEACGASNITVSHQAQDIAEAEYLILPGVGAFRDCMKGMQERSLVEPVLRYARSGRPLLGICVGMQMLATQSEEFGLHPGLDLIPGSVHAIATQSNGMTRKVPSIGWVELVRPSRPKPEPTVLDAVHPYEYVYLVHSYHVNTQDPEATIATYDYAGLPVTAAIQKDNMIGVQFHPEKSGAAGLRLISQFLSLKPM